MIPLEMLKVCTYQQICMKQSRCSQLGLVYHFLPCKCKTTLRQSYSNNLGAYHIHQYQGIHLRDVHRFVFQAVATYHLAGPITTCRTVHIYNSWYCRFCIYHGSNVGDSSGILSTFHTLEFAISFCLMVKFVCGQFQLAPRASL